MDVLEAALAIGRRGDAEQLAHALVPRARQVGERQVAREQRHLEPVAKDDVERVGDLVGIDPDQAALDPDRPAVEVVGGERRAVAPEGRGQERREIAEEGARAADLHLDQERLALVDRERARAADRLAAPGLGQASVVERMAGLVQDRHQARGGIALVVAGGHADVVGHAAAERMRALVQPAVVEIEAERCHQALTQRLLAGGREMARERQRRHLAGQHAFEKVRQEGRERREQAIDLGCGQARLVALEEGVVGSKPQNPGLGRRLLPGQPQDFLEGRPQQREIGLGARLAPDHLGARGRPRQRPDQLGLERGRVEVAPAHLAKVRRLPLV